MDQVKDHLVKNNFWNNNQHGSRVKHSTTTCVCEILEDSNKANEKGLMTAVTAVDMSSAFDLIDHKVLIQKCRIALIGNAGLTWLIDFLDNRSRMINVNGVNSRILKTGEKGVVQGGKSSCELFTLYINDLPAQVNGVKPAVSLEDSTAKEYIDDLSIISRGKDLEQLKANITKDLEIVAIYLNNHMMVIN